MPARIWDQVIGVFPPYLSLTLIHPDGRGHTHWTDLCHLEEVESRNWYEHSPKYASYGGTKERRMYLHWLPLGKPPAGMTIDHIDTNSLNSCRDNLRIVSYRDNGHNRRDHGEYGPGVKYQPKWDGYQVKIVYQGKGIFQPFFKDPIKAMKCRDLYFKIANQVDQGNRPIPTKEELQAISSYIRKGP